MIIQFDFERMKRASHRALPSPIRKFKAAFEDVQSLEDRLWSEFTVRSDYADLSRARVLLLGFDGVLLSETRKMVRAAGVASCATCHNVVQLQGVADMQDAFSHLIINFDSFETSNEAVGALLEFRLRQKEFSIVLVSACVSDDDLGLERKSICDATLRAPLSQKRMRDGLIAASLNHSTKSVAFS